MGTGGQVQAFVAQQPHKADGGAGILPNPVAVLFQHLKGNHDVALGVDGGAKDIAHRDPGQVDLGAGLEAADILENGPVFDVFLKESFLLGHDQDHDEEGRQRGHDKEADDGFISARDHVVFSPWGSRWRKRRTSGWEECRNSS